MIGQEPSFTVSDFVAVFNQSLEVMYPSVSIIGELSNFRISKNVWVYCDLKDEASSVKFFGSTRCLPGPLEDGMMLEVIGKPYLHPKFGFSVQMIAVRAVGEGSIKKAQTLLARKLEAEGLFDVARKRPLPFPPKRIGLITSTESAAYSDFTKIIKARWPALEIHVYSVHVQGADAPAQIVEALRSSNQDAQLEVLVMIRGGGSRDDLQAFDHEDVVRAVSASRIPTMVAIGHERDVALSELAADLRASTPSNAAELLVPDHKEEARQLSIRKRELHDSMRQLCEVLTTDARDALKDAERLVLAKVEAIRSQVELQKRLAFALDPRQPLARGFALVRNEKGEMVRSAAVAKTQPLLELEFSDGRLSANVDTLQ